MRFKDKDGFSLMEIMVVIAVIGIIAAIALPNFFSWLPNIRLKSSARDLYSNIQKAKLEATKRNVCVGMNFNTVAFPLTGGGYTVFVDDGTGGGTACNMTQDGTEATLSNILVENGISLISANFPLPVTTSFCFTPTAVVCSSQSGNIQLRHNGSRWYRATVSAAGGVRLEVSSDTVTWGY